MSRSNPSADKSPSPCQRWYEWKGGDGHFQHYDKEKKENIVAKLPFQFIVLDRTATVRGYNEKQESGIYSNEVRDTRSERFLVKFFKGGKIAEGYWADIKDTVTANDGSFAVNAYIAYKDGKTLKLGAIQFTGCSRSAWFDFEKKHRKDIFTKAIVVKKSKSEKVGKIEFEVPIFELAEVTEATNAEALKLDMELQKYFEDYFKRNKNEQATPARGGGEGSQPDPREDQQEPPPDDPGDEVPPDDDVPF